VRGSRTADVLDNLIPHLKAKGYRFDLLPEMTRAGATQSSVAIDPPQPAYFTTPRVKKAG
jgi:hypothetical protein